MTDEAFESIPGPRGRRLTGLPERVRMAELDRLEQEALAKAERDFAEQQRQVQEENRIRMLRAQGLNEAADAAALALDHERRLAEARKAGYDAATIAAIELANAAEKAAQAAELARQRQQAMEDLEVRRLRALGLDAQADRLSQQLTQQRELEEARRAGMSPEFIARLIEVQRLERERFGAGGTSASGQVVRSITGITETSALTLIHIGRTQVGLLAAIEKNTRRGSDGVWATGSASRGGIVVQVTVNNHGPITTSADWRAQGREIGRGIDEVLGLQTERSVQFDGDARV